jgi:hypothetical protein
MTGAPRREPFKECQRLLDLRLIEEIDQLMKPFPGRHAGPPSGFAAM